MRFSCIYLRVCACEYKAPPPPPPPPSRSTAALLRESQTHTHTHTCTAQVNGGEGRDSHVVFGSGKLYRNTGNEIRPIGFFFFFHFFRLLSITIVSCTIRHIIFPSIPKGYVAGRNVQRRPVFFCVFTRR